jgi:CheY-like chemotaxis protein
MGRPLEILFVEDNEADVEMVRRSLREEIPVCNLTVANDGSEALDRLFKPGKLSDLTRPHMILLDLNMPGMNGKEALKVIKADEHLKAVPVVILTSSGAPVGLRESYAHHANCYVVKRFDGAEFKSAVREIVNFWKNLVVLPESGQPQ